MASYGLCTIAEVLDWNGQWTRELVELMLPVALERQNAAERSLAKGAAAGVAAAFSKKGFQAVDDTFVAMESAIRDAQRVGRGGQALVAKADVSKDVKALDDAFAVLSKPLGRGRR